MTINYNFTATTTFDSINIGTVFFCGKQLFMKTEETFVLDEEISPAIYENMPRNAIDLKTGKMDWFDADNKITPCPNATISF